MMKNEKLIIKWQRLVENNTTCPRCSETEKEIEKAFKKLKEALKVLNIEVILKKYELNKSEFSKNPLSSNLILINDKPLEEWLGAEAGQSKCCSVCGDNDCRTVQFNGIIYESVPENLIIKACLLAASELISGERKVKVLNFK